MGLPTRSSQLSKLLKQLDGVAMQHMPATENSTSHQTQN